MPVRTGRAERIDVNIETVSSTPLIHVEQVLDADRRAPSIARGAVRAACAPVFPHVVDDAMLLVSEVVTNAVKHGSAPIRLQIDLDRAGIVVAVDDANPTLPRTRRIDNRRHSGRGLVLVQSLATDWGVRRTRNGKQVWVRLA